MMVHSSRLAWRRSCQGGGGEGPRAWQLYGLALAVLVGVSSCGFHLRGSQSASSAQPTLLPGVEEIFVAGDVHSETAAALREGLRVIGTSVAQQPHKGVSVLEVLRERFNTRVLTVGSDGKVLEKELSLEVRYRYRSAGAEEGGEPRVVRVLRDVLADERRATAQLGEEATLRREMAREAARRILRHIRAESP